VPLPGMLPAAGTGFSGSQRGGIQPPLHEQSGERDAAPHRAPGSSVGQGLRCRPSPRRRAATPGNGTRPTIQTHRFARARPCRSLKKKLAVADSRRQKTEQDRFVFGNGARSLSGEVKSFLLKINVNLNY